MRFMLELQPKKMSKQKIESSVLNEGQTDKYLDSKTPKKVIEAPNKIVI